MYIDSPPRGSKIEKFVEYSDLKKLGPVESGLLYTPKNYGYYNDNNIYIVEIYFGKDKGDYYDTSYIKIYKQEILNTADQSNMDKITAHLSVVGNSENVNLVGKNRVDVVENGKIIHSQWYYKVIYTAMDENQLAFISADFNRINTFNAGYERLFNF